MRPSTGEVVKMLEGSLEINTPPMPQTVLQPMEEGLDNVYRVMKREFNLSSFFTINSTHPSSRATCSYSTMSSRQQRRNGTNFVAVQEFYPHDTLILSRNIVFIDHLLPYIGMGNETSRELCIMLLLRFKMVKEIILIAKQKHKQLG